VRFQCPWGSNLRRRRADSAAHAAVREYHRTKTIRIKPRPHGAVVVAAGYLAVSSHHRAARLLVSVYTWQVN
jgi:hypothetical protein